MVAEPTDERRGGAGGGRGIGAAQARASWVLVGAAVLAGVEATLADPYDAGGVALLTAATGALGGLLSGLPLAALIGALAGTGRRPPRRLALDLTLGGLWALSVVAIVRATVPEPALGLNAGPPTASLVLLGGQALLLPAVLLTARVRPGLRAFGQRGLLAIQAFLLAGATLLSDPFDAAHRTGPAPLRVLLVTVDALRPDAVPAGGAMARLAREGTTFEATYTPVPRTGPAHVALLSGRGPWDGTPLHDDGRPVRTPLPLARAIGPRERAAAVISSELARPVARSGAFAIVDDQLGWPAGWAFTPLGRTLRASGLAAVARQRNAAFTTDAAVAALARGPALLWVHYADPVAPYTPGEAWSSRFEPGARETAGGLDAARPLHPAHGTTLDGVATLEAVEARYRGEVARVDHHLDRLLQAVPDDAIVVVAGTSAEALGEGGRFFRHGEAWPAEAHVPLWIRGPGVAAGGTVRWPVELTDLAPTILDQLADRPDAGGIEIEAMRAGMTGRSLRPAMQGAAPERLVARSTATSAGTLQALVIGPSGALRVTGEAAPRPIDEAGHTGPPRHDGTLAEQAQALAATLRDRPLPAPRDPTTTARILDLGGTPP